MRYVFSNAARVLAAGSAVVLGLTLAGCGSSGVSSTPPSAGASSSEIPLGTLSIDQSRTLTVSSLFTKVGAYASPVNGGQLHPLGGVDTRVHVERASRKDLTYYGGKVVQAAQAINVYVNNPASTWGTPSTFQTNLGASTMIHLVDQYMKPSANTGNGRYTYGGSYSVSGYNTGGTCAVGSAGTNAQGQPVPNVSIANCLVDGDIQQIVYDAASALGKSNPGYGYIFHVFLGQNVNHCSAAAGGCYSPVSTANFGFCAYHGSATITGIGYTLYSAEPYQNVSGCQVNGSSPNGLLIDSTSSTLSHETFETITDPDIALATGYASPLSWYNATYGEIGDECAPAAGVTTGTVSLNGKTYGIQPEYSNASHACKFST